MSHPARARELKSIHTLYILPISITQTQQNSSNSQQQLSPLRSRSSRSTVSSSDVALFTSNIPQNPKKKTEPCTTCRRSAQPERFHSHPKSPCVSPAKSPKDSLTSVSTSLASARSSPSVIPVRAVVGVKSSSRRTSALQSPTMSSPRSEQLVSSLASSGIRYIVIDYLRKFL